MTENQLKGFPNSFKRSNVKIDFCLRLEKEKKMNEE